jgi:hypothetical protein
MFIEGERKRKGIGYRIVKIYRYEETLERINLGYNLRIHYNGNASKRERKKEKEEETSKARERAREEREDNKGWG